MAIRDDKYLKNHGYRRPHTKCSALSYLLLKTTKIIFLVYLITVMNSQPCQFRNSLLLLKFDFYLYVIYNTYLVFINKLTSKKIFQIEPCQRWHIAHAAGQLTGMNAQ